MKSATCPTKPYRWRSSPGAPTPDGVTVPPTVEEEVTFAAGEFNSLEPPRSCAQPGSSENPSPDTSSAAKDFLGMNNPGLRLRMDISNRQRGRGRHLRRLQDRRPVPRY